MQYTQTAANRQTGNRFAAKWCCDTGVLRNHLLKHGNAYRQSICKRLRKYSASVCDRGLKMLSNRLESKTRHTGCRFARHLETHTGSQFVRDLENCCQIDTIQLDSNDLSPQMTTRHTGCNLHPV